MSDLLHSHLSFGFHAGCPACEQVVEDLAAHPGWNDSGVVALLAG
jgi:hypothetical protein